MKPKANLEVSGSESAWGGRSSVCPAGLVQDHLGHWERRAGGTQGVAKERIWVFPPLSACHSIWVAVSLALKSMEQFFPTVSVDLNFAGWGKGLCMLVASKQEGPACLMDQLRV